MTPAYTAPLHIKSPLSSVARCKSTACAIEPTTDTPTISTTIIRATNPGIIENASTGTATAIAKASAKCNVTCAEGQGSGVVPRSATAARVPDLLLSFSSADNNTASGRCCRRKGEDGSLGEGRGCSRPKIVGRAKRGLDDVALEPRLPERRLCRTSHELPCMVPGMGVTMGASSSAGRWSECRYSPLVGGLGSEPSAGADADEDWGLAGPASSVTRSSVESRKRVSTSEMGRWVAR